MGNLEQVAIFLLAAVVAVALFKWLRLGSVLGFLAAGIVLGPWGFSVTADIEQMHAIAEFGVVLLLFVIGLELQPSRLLVLRKTVFGLGFAQVLVTTLALGGAALLLGMTWRTALVVGFGLSLSSTPLVLQLLAERRQLQAQHGRSAFGILLFQDLAVMPALALLPLLAPAGAVTSSEPGWIVAAKLVAVLIGLVIGSRLLLRPLLRIVGETRTPEVFTAAALLVVIATALAVNAVGLSMALGAFLAGVLLADSEYRHELEADIEPFKGLLLGLFFMSVGISLNLGLLFENPLRMFGYTLAFMALKMLAAFGVGRLARHPPAAARRLAIALPAGGEFAFVLFALGVSDRILDPAQAEELVIAVTLSMALSPLLLSLYDFLAPRLAPAPAPFDTINEPGNRVIIAGYGRFGQIVSRVLRARRITFTVLEVSQTQIDFVRRLGNKVYYGDASRLELLRAAHTEQAEVFVLAIDDVEASVRTAELVRRSFPAVRVLARARNRQHAFRLMDLGVHWVIRDTYLSSLEMAREALTSLGVPDPQATQAIDTFREHDERTLALQNAVKDDETKLLATTKEAARQLEQLFEADVSDPES